METHLTDSFRKLAASWDDQPGFVNRDMGSGGIGKATPDVGSDDDIIKRWQMRKRRRRRNREDTDGIVRIYQLGIETPMTGKEEARPLLNL